MKTDYKNFYVEYYTEDGQDIITPTIYNDLKTLRGCKNRILRGHIPQYVKYVKIFTYTDIFKDSTFKLEEIMEL